MVDIGGEVVLQGVNQKGEAWRVGISRPKIDATGMEKELQEVIATGNVNAIKSVKGIGLKSAQRIIVDLKDKIQLGIRNEELGMGNVSSMANSENMEEAVAALVALGFQKAASVKVVEKLMKEDATMAVGKIVKRALSMM